MTWPCIISDGHLTLPLAVIQSDVDLLEAEAAVSRGGGEAVLAGVHPDRLNNYNQELTIQEGMSHLSVFLPPTLPPFVADETRESHRAWDNVSHEDVIKIILMLSLITSRCCDHT